MHATTARPKITVTADGQGIVSHAGSRLLADVAAATGLDAGVDAVAGAGRMRRSAHGPGRVLTDLAVMLAEGGEAISDLAVLREQRALFGPVASTATARRVLAGLDADRLAGLRAARAAAGSGPGWPVLSSAVRCRRSAPAGRPGRGLVIDIDATLVTSRGR